MKSVIILTLFAFSLINCTKPGLKFKKKLLVPRVSPKCKNIKCPAVERPICVKVKKNGSNDTIYVAMINECELEYMKCHQNVEGIPVSLKHCHQVAAEKGHLKTMFLSRKKRSARYAPNVVGKQKAVKRFKALEPFKLRKASQVTKGVVKSVDPKNNTKARYGPQERAPNVFGEQKVLKRSKALETSKPRKAQVTKGVVKSVDPKNNIKLRDGASETGDSGREGIGKLYHDNMEQEDEPEDSYEYEPAEMKPHLIISSEELSSGEKKKKALKEDKSLIVDENHQQELAVPVENQNQAVDKNRMFSKPLFGSIENQKSEGGRQEKDPVENQAVDKDRMFNKPMFGSISKENQKSDGGKQEKDDEDLTVKPEPDPVENQAVDKDRMFNKPMFGSSSKENQKSDGGKREKDPVENQAVEKDRMFSKPMFGSSSIENQKSESGNQNQEFTDPPENQAVDKNRMFNKPLFGSIENQKSDGGRQETDPAENQGVDQNRMFSKPLFGSIENQRPDSGEQEKVDGDNYEQFSTMKIDPQFTDPSENQATDKNRMFEKPLFGPEDDAAVEDQEDGKKLNFDHSESTEQHSNNALSSDHEQGKHNQEWGYFSPGIDTNDLKNNTLILNSTEKSKDLIENFSVNEAELEDYDSDCPSSCPSKSVMVCGKCQHGVYRTFLSVCHLRIFACHNKEEELELVSRLPCAMSAPYLGAEVNMEPKGHYNDPSNQDKVLNHIQCKARQEALLSMSKNSNQRLSELEMTGDEKCNFEGKAELKDAQLKDY